MPGTELVPGGAQGAGRGAGGAVGMTRAQSRLPTPGAASPWHFPPSALLTPVPFPLPGRSRRRDVLLLLGAAAHPAQGHALLAAHAPRLQGLRRGRHRPRGRHGLPEGEPPGPASRAPHPRVPEAPPGLPSGPHRSQRLWPLGDRPPPHSTPDSTGGSGRGPGCGPSEAGPGPASGPVPPAASTGTRSPTAGRLSSALPV